MQRVLCKHTPTRIEKAMYWAHVVWNHTPDFDFLMVNQVVRACLLADWMDGLTNLCPECQPDEPLHIHHLPSECDD
jgi:hypothetical protein